MFYELKNIIKEILNKKLPYKLIWGVKKNVDVSQFPSNITLVEQGTEDYIREISSSKVIIRNDRAIKDLENGLIKKSEQVYIQTWHGSLGIKKTGIDINQAKQKKKEYTIH